MKGTVGFLLLFVLPFLLQAQQYPRDDFNLQNITDDLYGFQDQDMNYEDLYENLAQLLAHPLDLNKADPEELRFLNILSEEQISELLMYRQKSGRLLSIYELQTMSTFDSATFHKIVPFVTVLDPASAVNRSLLGRIKREGDHYFLIRYERTLEDKKGFTSESTADNRFKGSPDKYYLRFRSSRPGDFSFGFTAEKDAGEVMQWNPQKNYYGFDYLSAHAQLQNKGRIKNIIIGDYQAQFAQGIMFGGLFGMGKGGETITTTRRSNIGFLPYTSTYETGLWRGVAATSEISKNVYASAFYSNTKRDANTEDGETETVITSFQNTGLHRNNKELANRKQITEENTGIVLQYKKDLFDGGVMFNHVRFDKKIIRNRNMYNQFYFQGKQNQNVGAYLNYTVQNFAFFSEVSQTLNGGHAYVVGALGNLSSRFDMALLHRKFSRNYYTFYTNAFGEGSMAQNESGVYWGWKYSVNKKISISGYTDLFRFPWIRYRSYAPSSGHEWLLRLAWQPTRKITLLLQAREESKVRNMRDERAQLYETAEGLKRNYLFNSQYTVSSQLKLRTRVQLSTYTYNKSTSEGVALIQDVNYAIGKFEIRARYALFDTQDYDNRQYVYEDDVWLAFSMPAYDGVGVRNYLLLEYKFNQHVSVWIKYARTRYTDRAEIGSGADLISGHHKSDIKFQLRIKF